jgi:beta-lactam-binding protein with PASTA domain
LRSIIRTEPAAGSQVAAGSTVVVYVSRPQVNTTAKVPALTGLKSVDDARSVLVQNKLGLGSTTEQYSDQPAGTIIGQSPAAGSTVKVNSRVSITVSAGPEPVPETPAEQPGSSSSDWWSGLIGGSSSSSGDSSSSEGTGLGDWWSALLS